MIYYARRQIHIHEHTKLIKNQHRAHGKNIKTSKQNIQKHEQISSLRVYVGISVDLFMCVIVQGHSRSLPTRRQT